MKEIKDLTIHDVQPGVGADFERAFCIEERLALDPPVARNDSAINSCNPAPSVSAASCFASVISSCSPAP